MSVLLRASRVVVAALAAVLLLVACQPGSSPSPASGALKVVATTTVFADIVQNVGGARVSVTSIVPPGVGPEDYEPKPDDARKLTDAALIISNGVGLDNFLDRLLTSIGGSAPRLVLGEGIPTIDVDGEPNPHFWLDPTLVKQYYLPAIVAKHFWSCSSPTTFKLSTTSCLVFIFGFPNTKNFFLVGFPPSNAGNLFYIMAF